MSVTFFPFGSSSTSGTLGVYLPSSYGAIGNNITDDTASLQAAITAAGVAGGGIVFLGPFKYKITSTLLLAYSNVTITGIGSGLNGSAICPAMSADTFRTTANVLGLTFSNFNIFPSITQTAGATFNISSGSYVTIEDVDTQSCYDWMSYGTAGTNASNLIWVRRCNVGTGGGVCARFGWHHYFGGGVWWEDSIINGNPTTGYFFFVDALGVATSFYTTNMSVAGFNFGMYVSANASVGNWNHTNLVMNAVVSQALYIVISSTPAGTSSVLQFNNCQLLSSNCNYCIYLESTLPGYAINTVVFNACEFGAVAATAQYCVAVQGEVTDVIFNACWITATTVAGSAGVLIGGVAGCTTQDITFTGNQFGQKASYYPPVGILISNPASSTIKNITVTGNKFINATSFPLQIANSGTMSGFLFQDNNCTGSGQPAISGNAVAAPYRIANNPGLNPVGSGTQPTVAASGTAVANPTPYDATVYISDGAGTVSVTITGLAGAQSAFTIPASAVATLRVPAGATVTLTYTSAPTWHWAYD